jgi:DNA-directed RNA polymerase subunit N (RpoN/RPB10)
MVGYKHINDNFRIPDPIVTVCSIRKQSLSGSEFTKSMLVLKAHNQVISYLTISIICCLIMIMSSNELINDDMKAQLKENKLESIANETNVLITAGVVVGDGPSYILSDFNDAIYVANYDSMIRVIL